MDGAVLHLDQRSQGRALRCRDRTASSWSGLRSAGALRLAPCAEERRRLMCE